MEAKSGLRFCANLKWLFTELPFWDRFAAAAQAGFTAVEYASPYEVSDEALRRHVDSAGLQTILINTPATAPGTPGASGLACHPQQRTTFRADAERALRYATALNCGRIHLMAGIVPEGTGIDAARECYIDNVAWAAKHAEAAGVTLLLEAVNQRDAPGFFLRTLEEGVEIIEQVGSPNVRLLFDIYHCQVSQGDVARRFEALLPWIGHIQVADVPRRSEPGTGEIGFPFLFDHIAKLGYDGWIGCEYRPLHSTQAGLGWLDAYVK